MLDIAKMVAVIEAEHRLIDGNLIESMVAVGHHTVIVCENPGHCAVGALLAATGVTGNDLANGPGDPDEFPLDWQQRLFDAYGVVYGDLDAIVDANDGLTTGDLDEEVLDTGDDDLIADALMQARRRLVLDTIRALDPDRWRNRPTI